MVSDYKDAIGRGQLVKYRGVKYKNSVRNPLKPPTFPAVQSFRNFSLRRNWGGGGGGGGYL